MMIKQARERYGLSQRGLAAILKVSAGLVGQWETPAGNEKSIKLPLLSRLCALLQIPVQHVVNGTDVGELQLPCLSDPKEIALITLFRELKPDQQKSHLALFYTTAGRGQPPEKD